MATRRKTVRTAARRRPASRAAAAPQSSGAVAVITWTAFAVVGLVLAAGVAALMADDIPYEDRWMRDTRHRLRNRALHTSNDAIDALRGQFAELQSDVRKQIAHIR